MALFYAYGIYPTNSGFSLEIPKQRLWKYIYIYIYLLIAGLIATFIGGINLYVYHSQ